MSASQLADWMMLINPTSSSSLCPVQYKSRGAYSVFYFLFFCCCCCCNSSCERGEKRESKRNKFFFNSTFASHQPPVYQNDSPFFFFFSFFFSSFSFFVSSFFFLPFISLSLLVQIGSLNFFSSNPLQQQLCVLVVVVRSACTYQIYISLPVRFPL